MSGNVTKEGITADLESMKRAGLGGLFSFDVGGKGLSEESRFVGTETRAMSVTQVIIVAAFKPGLNGYRMARLGWKRGKTVISNQ